MRTMSFTNANPVWAETFEWLYARQRSLAFDDSQDLTHMGGLVEQILGPINPYPGDLRPWLALCSALKERYTLTNEELAAVLSRVTFRQKGYYDGDEEFWID